MTTDELIAKLDVQYEKITSEIPDAYEELGRALYEPLKDTVSGLYRSDACYEMNQIRDRIARLHEIRDIQRIVRREEEKSVE